MPRSRPLYLSALRWAFLLAVLVGVASVAGLLFTSAQPALRLAAEPALRFATETQTLLESLSSEASTNPTEVGFPWRRSGRGSLRCLGIRPDCGCALISGLPEVLPEGAEGTLRVRIAPGLRPGPFLVSVRIYTDAAPPAERIVLRVRGFVGTRLRFHPDPLALGRRTAGRLVERTIEVHALSALALPDLRARLVGLSGAVHVGACARAGLGGCTLEATLQIPQRPGSFRGEIQLLDGAQVLGRVPVTGQAQ
jgi:hypothetical protein